MRRVGKLCSRWLVFVGALSGANAVAAPDPRPPPVVQFSLDRPDDVAPCMTEAVLRVAVAQRLGRDPFRNDAPDRVHVTLSRDPVDDSGLRVRARVERRDPRGQVRGDRELDAASNDDCAELVETLALSIAIAIDPLASTTPAEAPPVSEPAPAPAPTSSVSAWLAAGGVGTLGAEPSPSVGATLQLGAGRGLVRIAIEGRVDRGTSRTRDPGEIRVSSMLGLAIACLELAGPRICAIGGVERLRGEGLGFSMPRTDTTVTAVGGGRIAWPLFTGFLRLVPHLDALIRAGRTTFEVDGAVIERASRVHLATGISIELTFF